MGLGLVFQYLLFANIQPRSGSKWLLCWLSFIFYPEATKFLTIVVRNADSLVFMPWLEDFTKGLGGSLPFPLSPAAHTRENSTAPQCDASHFPTSFSFFPFFFIHLSRREQYHLLPGNTGQGPRSVSVQRISWARGSRVSANHLSRSIGFSILLWILSWREGGENKPSR